MRPEELARLLKLHRRWLAGGKDGERADLSYTDLRRATLYEANLSHADLYGADLRSAWLARANLRGADLSYTDLRRADIRGARLCDADLSWANLQGAELSGANLSCANLDKADLSWANLCDADLRGITLIDAASLRGTGVVAIGAEDVRGCVTPTHIHFGRFRLARHDIPADDDLAAQSAIDADMPDWARHRGLFQAAMALSAADWAAREEAAP